jgi:hypothetical protein
MSIVTRFILIILTAYIVINCSNQRENNHIPIGDAQQTTLDSLQGIWRSNTEENYFLHIQKNLAFTLLGKKTIDTSSIKVVENCLGRESQKSSQSYSKRYLVMIMNNDSFPMCYQILELSSKRLALDYQGRYHGFTRAQ